MKYLLYAIVLIFLFSCGNKTRNKTEYKDADLLFRYIDDSLKNVIDEPDFVFITYRFNVVCSNCRGDISLEEVLDSASALYPEIPTYIITDGEIFRDNKREYNILKAHCNNLKPVIVEDPKTLSKYGLYRSYPSMFLIENNTLIDARKFLKKNENY